MIVVNRFVVDDGPGFIEQARVALDVLAARTGFVHGSAGRATDDPTRWVLVTRWIDVGSYRRALGSYEVKVHATPLLAQALEEPSAFEQLIDTAPGGHAVVTASDLAVSDPVIG